MSQTMLLTRNLTQFLTQNTTSTIPTMVLLSPAGKLLSSSSPLSATQLRTQATLAYSLWTLYLPTIPSMKAALPQSQTQTQDLDSLAAPASRNDHELSTLTIQLTHAVVVIRALSCGLLFVAIATTSTLPSATSKSSPKSNIPTSFKEDVSANSTSNVSTPPPGAEGPRAHFLEIRLQSEKVAKWLDEQLDGFTLYTGEA